MHTGLVKRFHIVELRENFLRIAEELFSLRSHHHSARRSVEDHDSEVVFQILDGAAEVRLSDHENIGCLIDGTGSRNLHGVFHVQNIHTCPFPCPHPGELTAYLYQKCIKTYVNYNSPSEFCQYAWT